MPCWRCQAVLSEAEHTQAVAWDLCDRCRDELRTPPLSAPAADETAPEPEPNPEPRRAIAILGVGGELIAMVAPDVEVGGIMAVAHAAGHRQVTLREVER